MKRATAYAALASELESWGALPQAELRSALNQPPQMRSVIVDGAELMLEVAVSWASDKRQAFKVSGTAYGSSHLMTERLQEALIVPIAA